MELELFQKLGISLGLGLLVGLQREHQNSQLAGIRTIPLISLFGSLSALLATVYGGWIIAAGFICIAAVIMIGNFLRSKASPVDADDFGQTTEIAMLLMYAIGAYLIEGVVTVAVALGGGIAVLLHLKGTLHRFVDKIGSKDIKAIMQFAVISLVILPVLPDKTYGPYNVLNPHDIWLMVVLIVGIGLVGYFAYKILGDKAGTAMAGILGGLISSTATTVSYARRTKNNNNNLLAALIILIASSVAIVRVVIEVGVVAPGSLAQLVPPFATLFILMLAVAGVFYFLKQKNQEKMPAQENPAQLKTALVFGLIYALVTLATAAAKDYLGNNGLYIVAVISGLTDVDAITLSTAQLMNKGGIEVNNGWRVIMVANLSNLVFKVGLTGFLGSRSLFGRMALLFGLVLIGGLAILWFWPADLNFF